jgi:8-oxo-dGTP pyrophosphatase MutT (NUDIX family)
MKPGGIDNQGGPGRSDYPGRRGAVAVIVRQGRFLVIRRSPHVVAPGAYCFPGGGLEPGESEQQALVREIREELGAAVRPLRRVWRSVTPWHVHLSWWLSELEPEAQLAPDPKEVESVHWCTPEEMVRLSSLLVSNHHFLQALWAGQINLEL